MQRILSALFIGYFICLYGSNAGVEIITILLSLIGIYLAIKKPSEVHFPRELLITSIVLFLIELVSFSINTRYASMADSLLKFRWLLMVPFTSLVFSKNLEKYISYFLKVTLVSLPLLAILCVYQFFLGRDPFRTEMQNITPYGNYFRAVGMAGSLTTSYLIGMVMVFLISYLFLKKDLLKKEKIAVLVGLVSGIVIIFATISRGPLLTIVGTLFLGFMLIRKRDALIALGVSAVAFVIFTFSSSLFYQKFYELIHLKDESVVWRFKVWAVNLTLFKEHPLFGVGFGNPEFYLKEYYAKLGWADLHFYGASGSNYTEILAGIGILGFLAFYCISFLFLKYSYDIFKKTENANARALAHGLFAAQIYFHLSGVIEGLFFGVQTRYILLFFWTVTLALKMSNNSLTVLRRAQ